MVTRAKASIFKPRERMNCHVTTTSPLLRSHVHALRDLNWKEAMLDEYNALITNGTWVLVPSPANVNVVLFYGIDCDETFSPMVKPVIIRTVLSLAISLDWPIYQLDMKNAFLHASSTALLQRIIALLHSEFAMTDLGSLNYFLGISAHGPTLSRSLAGALPYLTFTRPDLSYAVQQVCLYMHDPRDLHFTTLKRILSYVRSTLDYGLQLHVSVKLPCLVLVSKLNIVAWPMWLLRMHELYANIFTKGLPAALFLEFRSSLNVRRPPVSTAGEY
nr:hypothetical protein [Tanacetum cinerariifolium]